MKWIACGILCLSLAGLFAQSKEMKVPVTFSGGHDTDPQDHGRPVILIAAGLNVPPEVFREAFSHVKPAPAGQDPQPGQVDLNKRALLNALGKYGVTNELLDRVSDYYRYNGRNQELWRNIPVEAFAMVKDGKVSRMTVTKPGAGYSSPPKISVAGVSGLNAQVQLGFGQDLQTNGVVVAIAVK